MALEMILELGEQKWRFAWEVSHFLGEATGGPQSPNCFLSTALKEKWRFAWEVSRFFEEAKS